MDGLVGQGAGKCPVVHGAPKHATFGGRSNRDWWPNQLNLRILHQNSALSNPMAKGFNYAEEFAKLDLEAVRQDLYALMTDSQEWWPADYGHYGPFFIRMAWHSAGTYRTGDGRGGASTARSASRRSTAGRTTATSTRRGACCGRSSRKYGDSISWADLFIFTGNCAIESMGSRPSASAAAGRHLGA
jgi:catalase-peroxidase